MNRILRYEIIGIVFIVFLGSFLHFTYELSGFNPVVGAFSAVNESTWEHLKLAVFPALIYAVFEFYRLKDAKNLWPAKAVSIYLMPFLIAVFFYLYLLFIPDNFVMDITIFVVAVVIGQLVSYRMLISKKDYAKYKMLTIVLLVLLPILFIVFTFYPPHIFLFQDPITGGYGIPH